jgi:filamentous hemagglutinin family protein
MFRLNATYVAVLAALSQGAYAQLAANALPTQGQVTQGQATIQQSGSQMQVQQQSQNTVINWGTYNIGKDAGVTYHQPNSNAIALNRVANGSSEIAGHLQANGKVYLLNPNGILFSSTAQVNVGSLVAAAGTVTDKEWASGTPSINLAADGQVVNQGNITAAQGGRVVLAGTHVTNAGTIIAPRGAVSLLAGQDVRINVTADGLIQSQLETTQDGSSAINSGIIQATGLKEDGGVVILVGNNVSQTGVINASSDFAKGGVVTLLGGQQLNISGAVSVIGSSGGRIDASANSAVVVENAQLNAQGMAGEGGVIRLGGDFQGGAWRTNAPIANTLVFTDRVSSLGSLASTQRLTVDEGSALNVSGATRGGVAVLWSEQFTSAQGRINARGGPIQSGGAGLGGGIEVSSHGQLYRPALLKYDAGVGGKVLLDPDDLYVVNVYSGTGINDGGLTGSNNWVGFGSQSSGGTPSEVLAGDVNIALNAGQSVILMTVRDLYVNAPITADASAFSQRTTLQLEAGRSMYINQDITLLGNLLDLKVIVGNDAGGAITAAMRGPGPSQLIQADGTTIRVDASADITTVSDAAFYSPSSSFTVANIQAGRTLDLGAPTVNVRGNLTANNLFIRAQTTNLSAAGVPSQLVATGSGLDTGILATTTMRPFQPETVLDVQSRSGFPAWTTIWLVAGGYAPTDPMTGTLNFNNAIVNPGGGYTLMVVPGPTAGGVPSSAYSVQRNVLTSDISDPYATPDWTGWPAQNTLVAYVDTLPTAPLATPSSASRTSATVQSVPPITAQPDVLSTTRPLVAAGGENTAWKNVLFTSADKVLAGNAEIAKLAECDVAVQERLPGNCIVKPKIEVAANADDGDDNKPARPVQTRRALVIGNAHYASPLSVLPGAQRDAEAVSELLKRRGFVVTQVTDATRADMVRALNTLIESSGPDDSVVVYYAGHGHIHPGSSVGYWLPVDANVDDPSGWLANTDLPRFMKNLASKQILLVSDSCFSGALTRESATTSNKPLNRNALLKRRAVTVMSSGGEEPVADLGANGHSPFTGALVRAMEAQPAGSELRAQTLAQEIAATVTARYRQTPQYGVLVSAGHVQGADYLFDGQ